MDWIIDALKNYVPIFEAIPPDEPGFYAFYILTEGCFEDTVFAELRKCDIIYIGIAKDETLEQRVFKKHLRNTGQSTLRRSLGAALMEKLDIKPIMRGINPTPANISHYTFSIDDEQRLTDFIYGNLGIAFCACNSPEVNNEDTESNLIEAFNFPAFNIEYAGVNNPYKQILKYEAVV